MGMYTVKTKHFSSLTPLNFLHSSYHHLQKPLILSCYCFWIKQKPDIVFYNHVPICMCNISSNLSKVCFYFSPFSHKSQFTCVPWGGCLHYLKDVLCLLSIHPYILHPQRNNYVDPIVAGWILYSIVVEQWFLKCFVGFFGCTVNLSLALATVLDL